MKNDVYAYGMISSSTLHVLEGKYPEPDCYAEIKESYRMVGGEAANSAIVLGKFGVKVKLDGNWLGHNEEGRITKDILEKYQLDVSRLTMKENYRGVTEIVFADGKNRTIFGTYVKLLFTEKQWNDPQREDIEPARLVCLDPFFKEASLSAARLCREMNKPYVSIDAHPEDEISQFAEVMIISGEFRHREYSSVDKETLFEKYKRLCRGLIIFTSGSEWLLYGRGDQETQRFKPYNITPVDTAGGGDSFRSGIIYGMLQGWPEEKTIDFACALAACVCMSFPGVLNSP
ncbi:MAG TPA: PfkB family carbohydrate kinase, partial [Bacillota bacterium]|nr:PfkB family carbohydrate kinase [Bacillota bacterium]